MPVAKTQADQRRDMNAKDQFGRLWLMTVEKSTGDPCGGIDCAGWSDPLHTPMKYKKVPKTEFGGPGWGQLFIDFDAWIRDNEMHDKSWQQRQYEIATVKYPAGFNAQTIFDDPYITQLNGPRPWPTSEALRKAKAGHQGLLGLRPMDNETRKLLGKKDYEMDPEESAPRAVVEEVVDDADLGYPTNWPDFLRYVMKTTGEAKTMQEASALWKTHKALLQEA